MRGRKKTAKKPVVGERIAMALEAIAMTMINETEVTKSKNRNFCEVEGCEERCSTMCPKHTLSETDGAVVVDQVYVIYATDDGLSGAESTLSVKASEKAAREYIAERIADMEDATSRTFGARDLEKWNGQKDVQIGTWCIAVKAVEL